MPSSILGDSRTVHPVVGLGAKVALIVVLGSLLLVGGYGYLGTTALEQSIQRTLQERVLLAQTTARHLDSLLAMIEDILTDSAAQEGWREPDQVDAALERGYRRLSFFATRVFLLDRNAQVVAANPPLTSPLALDHFASVSAVLNGQSFAVSRYTRPLDASGSSTIAAVPIRDADNQVTHALLVSLDLTSPNVRAFTHPIGLGETGYLDLVDLNGTILASTRPARLGHASDHENSLARMIRAQQPNVSQCHNCHSATETAPQREILALAPLERAQWGVTVRQSEDEVFETTRFLQTRLVALWLLTLAIGLLFIFLTMRVVIVPIQALTAATRRIAVGDLGTPLQLHGQDEIGVLARSFDAMRARLQDAIAEIRTWHYELDARVRVRSAECEMARAEIEQLYVELRHKERARRELLHRVISAQEEERKRIARELHDETSQTLIGMVYRLERAAEMLARGKLRPAETRVVLEKLLELTQSARGEVNRVIWDLRPMLLDQLGLVPALRSYAEERFAATDLSWNIRIVGEPRRLAPPIEAALFRVAQEALNNIARHSHARHTDFIFEYFDNRLRVQISDDGVGFDPMFVGFSHSGARGLGLLSMEERMKGIGGEFELQSASGTGTTITLTALIENSS
ncbi:MAG: HAMP domain-containing protein [Anaerolineales bacterium]|nr:HAMP domain-containing protein [Anaerolineales bacterium]